MTRRLTGLPLRLMEYPAETVTNRRFAGTEISRLDRFYLPPALTTLYDPDPLATSEFIEDDNRAAILPDPIATLDGREFFLSVKGVGSTIDPYSWKPLDRSYASELVSDPDVGARLQRAPTDSPDRIITGELWLRGSPYGGQGWEHASAALAVSERANLTDLAGFRIAPVVKVAYLPAELEERLRKIYWYRRYPGRMVQELPARPLERPSVLPRPDDRRERHRSRVRPVCDRDPAGCAGLRGELPPDHSAHAYAVRAHPDPRGRRRSVPGDSTSTTYGWTRTR